MATLKEQLAQLSDEELLALEKEMLAKNTPEGIRADSERLQASGVGGVGRGLLEGASRGGRAVVSGVRELAGISALPEEKPSKEQLDKDDLTKFEAKERIKQELKKEFADPSAGGLQIVNLPGGGFAVVPSGVKAPTGDIPTGNGVVGEGGKPT